MRPFIASWLNRQVLILLGFSAVTIALTSVVVWNLTVRPQELFVSPVAVLNTQGAYCLDISADNTLLAVGHADGTVKVWGMKSHQEWTTIQYEGGDDPRSGGHSVLCIRFSSDSKTLAWGGQNQPVTLYDIPSKTKKCQLTNHEGPVECISFSPDGRMFATGTLWGVLRIWRVGNGDAAIVVDKKLHETVRSMDFNSTGTHLAVGVFGGVILVNAVDGKERTIAQGYSRAISNVTFDRQDQTVAGNTGKVAIWDVKTGNEVTAFVQQNPTVALQSFGFSPDRETIAMALCDGVSNQAMLEFWDVTARCRLGRLVFRGGQSARCLVSWSRDGSVLVTPTAKTVEIWDYARLLKRLSPGRDLHEEFKQ